MKSFSVAFAVLLVSAVGLSFSAHDAGWASVSNADASQVYGGQVEICDWKAKTRSCEEQGCDLLAVCWVHDASGSTRYRDTLSTFSCHSSGNGCMLGNPLLCKIVIEPVELN